MADGLYGVKQASKTKARHISSSTSLAFSSNLLSLISSASSSAKAKSTAGRPRPSKDGKSDIFTAHNKNVKKRSAADLEDGVQQQHQTQHDIGSVEAAELQRSKRRMEDKVRLYNAMKRGEYIGRDDYDNQGLVDFDRKWAEDQGHGARSDDESQSDEEVGSDTEDVVEYLDEFGRLRTGTKSQAAREQRRQRMQHLAAEEEERLSARPSMPSAIIHGDAIQHQAFNPDQVIADRMAEIAKKRDRSATPPPDTHFDASAEIRTRGTGFYAFSQDSEQRKKEMDALEQERLETERVRKEREELKERRRKDVEERRRLIAEQRAKAQADKFLNELDIEGL